MNDKDHFPKIYWLLFTMMVLSMAYVFAVSLLAIPKENQQLTNNISMFLLGSVVAGIIGYLCTGTPPVQKKPIDNTTTTAEVSATITQSEEK